MHVFAELDDDSRFFTVRYFFFSSFPWTTCPHSTYPDFAALGLPVLTNLKSLHFIMSPPDLSNLLTFITHLLWNLPSVHMESVTLKFLPIYDTTKKSVIKPSKSPPTLPLLKKLEIAFNFESEVDYGWVLGLLKKQFSKYEKRGILLLKSNQQA